MILGRVDNSPNMANHDCGQVNLLTPLQQISLAHVHGISKVTSLTSGNNILNHKPKQQLMQWHHFPLSHRPGHSQMGFLG